MKIRRRELLAGVATLSLATLAGSLNSDHADGAVTSNRPWHPLTRSLLDRAARAGRRVDRPRLERIVREVAGERGRPVIKWLPDPKRAFEHLRRYPLDELAQMPTAQFWPFPSPVLAASDDEEERSVELYLHATQVLGVEEHGRALMAPKLSYKEEAIATRSCPESILEARAVASEIGWIETTLPAVAARAIRSVEDLLSAGHAEGSMEIYHQLMVFEAFEHGLLATWETPEELICLPLAR
jgi:hypothetical protein